MWTVLGGRDITARNSPASTSPATTMATVRGSAARGRACSGGGLADGFGDQGGQLGDLGVGESDAHGGDVLP
ncbi:hypothetical protein BDK92_0713 [Micromonospora pisi]|uniref:Uncharacterized protein n=1 Tax=Micromonospora pisi TaxID=589240 RepID=A0A495JCC5_9ACTN|nr:hypothetical protein BDK92_0713 [Micromonospora pisi]